MNSTKDTNAGASTSTSEVPDDPTTGLANICVLADEICQREKGDDNVLGALQLMFDKKRLKEIFPRRIEEVEPHEESQQKRFKFNDGYISHLTSVMTLSSETLNDFLQVAGSKRTFSYGSSKYYDNQTFDEVLHREWPAQTIALNLERRLLDRITMAHRAISIFMTNADLVPGRGMPHLASPAFTDNSMFAFKVAGAMYGKDPIIVSLKQEDASWALETENEAQTSYYRAVSESPDDEPVASTSYGHLDKGKGKAQEIPRPTSSINLEGDTPLIPEEEPKEGNKADDEGDQCPLSRTLNPVRQPSGHRAPSLAPSP